MSENEIQIGTIVDNSKMPEWGPGRVLDIRGDTLIVYFRDYPGEGIKKIGAKAGVLTLAPSQTDAQLDNLPPYKDGKFKSTKRRVTLDEGIKLFHNLFPLYFADPKYQKDPSIGERNYKLEAHDHFVKTLGGGQREALLATGNIDELCKRALAVEGKVNLLSPYEKMALRDGLKNEAAARRFFKTLFYLLEETRPSEVCFEAYIDAVSKLPVEKGKSRVTTWPVLTVLPFLADPRRHMFLKPEVTKACADRLTFDLNYRAELNWLTYKKLLEMSDILMQKLGPLGAQDFIDVQSFIWVIGNY